MALTAEQREADDALRQAVDQCVKAYSLADPTDLIVDYVVVGVAVPLDDERQGETQHFVVMPGETIPAYRLVGLLRMALVHHETP